MSRVPLVTIGLPVYNGESYLAGAIESVLSQDFGDFELLISDNRSSDSTWDMCQKYARTDKRIRLHRQQHNCGSARNFDWVFRNSCGRYFMWTAHDDLLDPLYVGRCLAFLEKHSDYVISYALNTAIDEAGRELYVDISDGRLDSDVAVERFQRLLGLAAAPYAIYGVIRRSALTGVNITRCCLSPDWVILLQLCLVGKIHQLYEPLRFYRLKTKQLAPLDVVLNYMKDITGADTKKYFPRLELLGTILWIALSKPETRSLSFQLVRQVFRNISLPQQVYLDLLLLAKTATIGRPLADRLLDSVHSLLREVYHRIPQGWKKRSCL